MALGEIAAILNGLDAAVFVIDKSRNVLLANSAATALFGNGLEGENFVRAVRHPDCLMAIETVLDGAPKFQISISVFNPAKTTYRVTITSLLAKNKRDAAAVISFENISHIGEAEQMRSDFVANVSHELRSPLTALTGFIETLKGPAKDDEAARVRFLDTMDREARRMNRLIEDLLSLSKVEVDEHVRPTGSVEILSVVEQVINVLSPLLGKERKSIHRRVFGMLKTSSTLMALMIGAGVLATGSVSASARDRINIVGSSTVFPFSTTVAERFGKKTKFKTPIVESTRSGGGLKLFCAGIGDGQPDITNASHRIKKSEIKKCASNGVKGILEVKIGYDGIVLANSLRTKLMDLSLKDIFLALAKNVPDGDGKTRPTPLQDLEGCIVCPL